MLHPGSLKIPSFNGPKRSRKTPKKPLADEQPESHLGLVSCFSPAAAVATSELKESLHRLFCDVHQGFQMSRRKWNIRNTTPTQYDTMCFRAVLRISTFWRLGRAMGEKRHVALRIASSWRAGRYCATARADGSGAEGLEVMHDSCRKNPLKCTL